MYAANVYHANQISYKDTTVESALNELYTKSIQKDQEVYLNNYVASEIRGNGWNCTRVKPTLSVNNNTATIKTTSVTRGEGTVYVEIAKIEEYKQIILQVNGSAITLWSGLINNLSDLYSFVPDTSSAIISFNNYQVGVTSSNVYIDTSNLSGKYYLAITGTSIDATVVARGVKR